MLDWETSLAGGFMKPRTGSGPADSCQGQAYTEYVVILVVLLGLGFAGASVLVGFDAVKDIFYGYYSSLANYLNAPFF